MRRRRAIVILSSFGLAAALAWTAVGGITIAAGQEKPIVIKRAHSGTFRPSFDKPIFILALGSDSGSPRHGRGGKVERGRADSIHIVAIEPRLKKATIVGIPRDSYVSVSCAGKRTKINSGMFFGGPACMVQTVEALSGVKFDYYAVGGFDNVENMINDAFGKIPVQVPPGVKGTLTDTNSRAKGIKPGLQLLNGQQAVAFGRDRHDYARGDFDRSEHQGRVMLGGLTKARADVRVNPGRMLDYLKTVFRNVKTDIPLSDAFRLGLLMLQINPKDVTNLVLTGGTGTTDAGSSVLLDAQAIATLHDVAADALIG